MKVAVYHPFTHFAENYSLSHVVREQLKSLSEHKVPTVFVTSESFKEAIPYPHVETRAVLPYNGKGKIYRRAKKALANATTVLTHDIVYLSSYRDHENALKRYAGEHPEVKWLHWSHSAPTEGCQHIPFSDNSVYVGMNRTDLPLVAKQFQVPEGKCQVVYNPVSPDVFFDWHPFTKHLVDKHSLLNCDVLVTYPLDTGRFEAKGGSKIIKLVEAIRKYGQNAKVVFVNAAANTPQRRELVEKYACDHAIFTSREDQAYEVSVPRRVVRELFQISNLFPLLSISEGCSLTLLEAGLSKCLIVLNEDFPPMREFGEIDHVLYMKVSSTRAKTEYHALREDSQAPEDKYFQDWAQIITTHLANNHALKFNRKVLKQFNREWIWRNQLEPLLA